MSQSKGKGKSKKANKPAVGPSTPTPQVSGTFVLDSGDILGVPAWDGSSRFTIASAKGTTANVEINGRIISNQTEEDTNVSTKTTGAKDAVEVQSAGTCKVCDTAKAFCSFLKNAFMKPVNDVLPAAIMNKLPAKAQTAPIGGAIIGTGAVVGLAYLGLKRLFSKKA